MLFRIMSALNDCSKSRDGIWSAFGGLNSKLSWGNDESTRSRLSHGLLYSDHFKRTSRCFSV